jgi:hypothetical protein
VLLFTNTNIFFVQNNLFATPLLICLIRQKFVLIRIYNNPVLRFFIRCHFLQNNPSNVFLQIFSSTFTVIYPLSYKNAKSGNGYDTYSVSRFRKTHSANKYNDTRPLLERSPFLTFKHCRNFPDFDTRIKVKAILFLISI